MENKIRILMLEDCELDAELIQRELKKAGMDFTIKVVNNKLAYENCIHSFDPEVIISDHSLPNFSSSEAYDKYLEVGLNIPFILVTGTVSEEFAVSSLKRGIDDYVLKSNLIRLPSSIEHALKARKVEAEKQRSQDELRRSELQIRNFATHLDNILEQERAKISREIHDELGQQLIGIKYLIDFCKNDSDSTDGLKEKLAHILGDIDHAIHTTKEIASGLRPAILDSFGLIPAIEWMSKEFEAKTNIKCKFENSIEDLKVEDKISTTLFRICQETLNNIAKHSGASEAYIEMERTKNNLILEISDNGKGIDEKNLKNSLSMGIIGMHERAKIIGAKLNIRSGAKLGTSVTLSVSL
jgi:two-component system sensor histidine kinase UhpB